MQTQRWKLLAFTVAAALLSRCEARTVPLASTATASDTLAAPRRSRQSRRGAARQHERQQGTKKKSAWRVPKSWGRTEKTKTKPANAGADDATKRTDAESSGDPKTDPTEEAEDRSKSKETNGDRNNDDASSPSSPSSSSSSRPTTSDDASNPKLDAKEESAQSKDDGKITGAEQPQPPPVNQTRPGVLFLAPSTGPMVPPHARPMPYPYNPQQQKSPPPRKKSLSLLSSLLPALAPGHPQMPPSPYGPPAPPPPGGGEGHGAVASLLLRLALLSLSSSALDVLGLGARSEAFLPGPAQHYTFERLNDRYRRDGAALRQALESPPAGVRRRRWRRALGRRRREAARSLLQGEGPAADDGALPTEAPSLGNGALYNRTVIVLDLKPDSRVGNGVAEHLRDAVSFIIEQHRDHAGRRARQERAKASSSPGLLRPYLSARSSSRGGRDGGGALPALGAELEVVLFLNSPGGTVHDYGLASSQLSRLRDEPQITLSVCVDRVAASGGYMMACQATPGHLFAAPFAMVGSIGVLMETVNFNEVLRRYGIKPLIIKAGANKAPLSGFGEVTQEELKTAQDDADGIHEVFQQWVARSRPNVVVSKEWMEKVCTGAVFLGQEACELGLVDRVLTSDEYVADRIASGDRVLRLIPYKGPQFGGLHISPLDLLRSGMDAEGRAKMIREKMLELGRAAVRCVAPLLRVGVVVNVLNHLASLHRQGPEYCWVA